MSAPASSGTAQPDALVEIHQEGGLAYFPGLSKPQALDLAQLDAAEQAELRRMVEAAGFFAQPPRVGAAMRGAADQQRSVLTIALDGRRHTVSVLRPVADDALRALLDWVQAHVKAQRLRQRKPPAPPAGG
ncbi:protealysin inhibitor emfourin [Azohydromonas caseinilytica]|uniref:Uncharacterized protein n=1 Tax=Azohydromonas caseinilytica TaxID=2728836 RepID=A0A848F4R8_9BURK|nr:protealysin inhibitor emfourin [Azohydromonas caseinilytica]NML13609.1 hypothetical protein [Azohydromonas caseinilytica]